MNKMFDVDWMLNIPEITDHPQIQCCFLHLRKELYLPQTRIVICKSGDNALSNHDNMPSHIKKLYTTNCNILPNERYYGLPYGTLLPLKQVINNMTFDMNKNKLAYCNFGLGSHPQRPHMWNQMICMDFITCESPPKHSALHIPSLQHFFRQVASSKFVICPPGNGPDTYRMWEALVIGSIPIVIKSPMIEQFKHDLPILDIGHYGELTENLLLEEYDRISNTHYPKNYLNIQYWIDRWKEDLNE